jgi:hypothetical protein
VIILYTLAVFGVGIAFIFTNGIVFALCFLGTTMVPCIAVAGMKWGFLRGDKQQKVGVPLVAIALLGFAYWLSTGVSIQVMGHHLSGLALGLIGAFIGLVGVPLSWGGSTPNASPPEEPRQAVDHRGNDPRLVRKIIAGLIVTALAVVILFTVAFAVLRDHLYNLYVHRLDTWVSSGGDAKTVQSELVEPCGKLVLTQAGSFERLELLTFYRDEFDFRVDVCVKITANRLYKQPEFEKPEMAALICKGAMGGSW